MVNALGVILMCVVSAQPRDVVLPDGGNVIVETWVENLEIPWSLVFLPDGRALVSERPGRIRLIRKGKIQEELYAEIEVAHVGEGGLMGLALHPQFPEKPYVYAMHTYRETGDLYNRVIRLKDNGNKGVFDKVVMDGLPGGRSRNGGRIAFGPDGMLYIAMGETFKVKLAQDKKSLGGKILRVTSEGEIPQDNPFPGSPIWSYGHKNPQGLAWDPDTGAMWESEHGLSGEYGKFDHDELNVIVKGENYGWPEAFCGTGSTQFIEPVVCWKGKSTPPSGIAFYRGDLWVATLGSRALIRISFLREGRTYTIKRIERWFENEESAGKYGRIRDVVAGPDGNLYFLTSNTDGLGIPRLRDDKIYRFKLIP